MLTSSNASEVVSCLGSVDRGSLWVYSDRDRSVHSVNLSSARYLELHGGRSDYFAVSHHFENGGLAVSVHRFPDVETKLSSIVVNSSQRELVGPEEPWHNVPNHYTAYLRTQWWSNYALVRLDLKVGHIELQEFTWYDDRYDKGYQGIVGVAEIPSTELLLVSVQRSSTLVIYDPLSRAAKGEVQLAGRAGNPRLFFRQTSPELWADDYDTILRLDTSTWKSVIQGASNRAYRDGPFHR